MKATRILTTFTIFMPLFTHTCMVI